MKKSHARRENICEGFGRRRTSRKVDPLCCSRVMKDVRGWIGGTNCSAGGTTRQPRSKACARTCALNSISSDSSASPP